MNKENDRVKNQSSGNGCLAYILFWAGGWGLFIILDKMQTGLAREVGEYLVIGIIIFLLLYFLFNNGISGLIDQFAKLVFWGVALLVAGSILSHCDGGGSYCAYRVGCW